MRNNAEMRSRLVLPILLAVLTAATPSDDGKVRETVQRMRVIAEAIRLYSTDVSDIPRATSMRELEARLVSAVRPLDPADGRVEK